MTDEHSKTKDKSARDWPLPSWTKISEFVLNVIQIERSVEQLKSQNTKLQDEIERLQRQLDEQNGQMKAIMAFINSSLRDQVDARAEKAAWRLFERFSSIRADLIDKPD